MIIYEFKDKFKRKNNKKLYEQQSSTRATAKYNKYKSFETKYKSSSKPSIHPRIRRSHENS